MIMDHTSTNMRSCVIAELLPKIELALQNIKTYRKITWYKRVWGHTEYKQEVQAAGGFWARLFGIKPVVTWTNADSVEYLSNPNNAEMFAPTEYMKIFSRFATDYAVLAHLHNLCFLTSEEKTVLVTSETATTIREWTIWRYDADEAIRASEDWLNPPHHKE